MRLNTTSPTTTKTTKMANSFLQTIIMSSFVHLDQVIAQQYHAKMQISKQLLKKATFMIFLIKQYIFKIQTHLFRNMSVHTNHHIQANMVYTHTYTQILVNIKTMSLSHQLLHVGNQEKDMHQFTSVQES